MPANRDWTLPSTLRVYAAWAEGAIESDIRDDQQAMTSGPSPGNTTSSPGSARQSIREQKWIEQEPKSAAPATPPAAFANAFADRHHRRSDKYLKNRKKKMAESESFRHVPPKSIEG